MKYQPIISVSVAALLAFSPAFAMDNVTSGIGVGAQVHTGASVTPNMSQGSAINNSVTGNASFMGNFSSLDANGDGAISSEEYKASNNTTAFSAIDADSNNSISASELDRFLMSDASTGMSLESFAMLDTDQNGSISQNEFSTSRSKVSFSSLDTNHSGFISEGEMNAYLNKHR